MKNKIKVYLINKEQLEYRPSLFSSQIEMIKAEEHFKEKEEWIKDLDGLAKAKNEIITQREKQVRELKQQHINSLTQLEKEIDKIFDKKILTPYRTLQKAKSKITRMKEEIENDN